MQDPSQAWRFVTGGVHLNPLRVALSDLPKGKGFACSRCKAIMDEVVRIAPVAGQPGLIGYECPACCYVTSVLLQPENWRRPRP